MKIVFLIVMFLICLTLSAVVGFVFFTFVQSLAYMGAFFSFLVILSALYL